MAASTTMGDYQTQSSWRPRLGSALRTALACTIVGCTTLYGPPHLRKYLTYPSFSYMTTILIVPDAKLGDVLRSCWHVMYATVQVMVPSVLTLWLVGPKNFDILLAAVAVAVSAFVVALPESTHLMSKRIAFGQLVNVYVGTVVHGAQTGVVMHPLGVAASTALGALASVLALLFPYPRLAYFEVKKSWRMYAENASQRLTHFVEAVSAQDKRGALEFISQEQSLSKAAAKLHQSISNNLVGMVWERPQMKFLKPNYMKLGEQLQETEIPLRGMEIALSSCSSFPLNLIDEELRGHLQRSEVQISLRLLQSRYSMPSDATTAPETNTEILDSALWIGKPTTTNHDNMAASFFLYCMELLLENQPIARNPGNSLKSNPNQEPSGAQNQAHCNFKRVWKNIMPSLRSLVFALKCSLALGLAVLFGLIYNKENGYWAGLTIAIGFVTGRQATFTVTNARAQGTAMGSVYGVIWLFLFQGIEHFRLLPLIPWIFFTHFLRHSRMYGQAGGISAAIGALLILGRENYGPPSEFAIARMTEACIGLICFVLVESLFYPMRAVTLARNELSKSMGALRDCIKDINLCVPASAGLREKQRKLKSHLKKLENFLQEAETEPNFWFLPFKGASYSKVLGSLSKMADLLLFVACETEFLSQVTQKLGGASEELRQHMNADLELLKEKINSSLKCLEEVTSIKSVAAFETEAQHDYHDSELGKPANPFRILGEGDEEVEIIVSILLQHFEEVADNAHNSDSEEKRKSQMVLCLASLGFCIRILTSETMEMEKQVRKLVKWESPSRHKKFLNICCKADALDANT
ncbi:unnamed protein product [Prunus armeniaca]|uniref:Uncharacterized protein n=1 Tax=Prunus armeniaca TaxID=36596 RepID=A0A6J5V9N5_PRUAR|nr:unnamed protein product [Prunus armeniaca]